MKYLHACILLRESCFLCVFKCAIIRKRYGCQRRCFKLFWKGRCTHYFRVDLGLSLRVLGAVHEFGSNAVGVEVRH